MAFLTEKDRTYTTPEDICAHLGDDYDKFSGAIVPPIFQNSLFVQPTEVNGLTQTEYAYTRVSNPTVDIAERKIAALEGGDGALCFGSGMAAISSAILHYAKTGCHIVAVSSIYGPSASLIRDWLAPKFGVTFTFVDGRDISEIRDAIRPETSLIYLESPSSIVFRMQDLEAVAALAKEHGIGTVIDNTYATPLHQNPLRHGIDIVCHTATKYLGGHSDILGGAVVANREIISSIQGKERALLGGNMDPHQAWLLIRGIRTLPLRLKQHGENGRKIAAFLETHPAVETVYYPGSATYAQKDLFAKYLTGTNGLLSFTVKGDADTAKAVVGHLYHFQNGCSWGGFESLAIYIGGDTGTLIRIHAGLEDAGTLIEDLNQALNRVL